VPQPIQVAVVGAGSFGRNHLRVYREMESLHPELLHLDALVEPDAARRSELAAQYNIPAFASVSDLLSTNLGAPGPSPLGTRVTAASVCVPTLHHAAVAQQLLLAGIDVLIEKPFAATLSEADHILALARQRNRIVQIGHLERFNPAVTALAARITRPMFFEAHRLSIFTPRSLDIDVVLDLMIHDLDIVLALTRSAVTEVRAVGLPVLSPKVDIANVRLEFASGCVANFTASRVSTELVRKLRLFQPHQYLSLDFARQDLLSIDVDPALLAAIQSGVLATKDIPAGLKGTGFSPSVSPTRYPGASAPEGATTHPSAGLSLQQVEVPHGEPLRLELENFLHAVRTRTAPRVTGDDGRAALALALEINDRIAAHAQRAGLA
jgi:predicted dehydrogenase